MRVRLDEESLKTIANVTRGEYFYAGNAARPAEDLQESQHQALLRAEGNRDHRAVRGGGAPCWRSFPPRCRCCGSIGFSKAGEHDGARPRPRSGHEHGGSELSEMDVRVRALESLLVEKGYVDPKALDAADRDVRDEGRPAQRRARGRPRVDGSAISRTAARRCDGGDRVAGLHRSPGRAHGRAAEQRARAQHGGLHAVLLLPVARSRAAAGVVQVGAVSRAGRHRSARRAGRLRRALARGRRNAGLGFDRGGALPGAARAHRPEPTIGPRSSWPRSSRATR